MHENKKMLAIFTDHEHRQQRLTRTTNNLNNLLKSILRI